MRNRERRTGNYREEDRAINRIYDSPYPVLRK